MLKYFSDFFNNSFTYFLTKILTFGGNIPQHIAVIMDGNRRFAKKHHLKEGHSDGSITLMNLLKWSIDLNIKEVTVFAFSIDNFNRSQDEKDLLLNLFKKNFKKYSVGEESKKLGIKICIYGNKTYFDEETQKSIEIIEDSTKNNNKLKLNICIAYNSTEEIYQAKCKISDINNKDIISEFESNLYGGYNLKPELLIRTSGETRLSNFLLYQCRFSIIIIIEKYWPELTFFDYFLILVRYSNNYANHIKLIYQIEKINKCNILSKDN